MSVIIGIDPHKATHTAVAIDGDEQPMATLQGLRIDARPTGCWPGRHHSAANGPGDRVGRGVGQAARAADGLRRRARRGCSADVVGAGPVAGLDQGRQERQQRCAVDCHRRAAAFAGCARSASRITTR
jgi:hypothetical protein